MPGLLGALAACAACATGAPGRDPSSGVALRPSYGGEPTAEPVRAGSRGQVVRRAVERAASAAGVRLSADGRLAEVAQAMLQAQPNSVPQDVSPRLQALVRRAGIADVGLQLAQVPMASTDAAAALAEAAFMRLASARLTHYGVACDPSRCLLLLSERSIALEPVPRRLPAGARIVLRGQLVGSTGEVFVEVDGPDGERDRYPAGVGPAVDVQVPTAGPGRHIVELRLRSEGGERAVARFWVAVGEGGATREARVDAATGADAAPPGHLPQPAAELARRAGAARRLAGLPPLQSHSALNALAARASLDLRAGRPAGGSEDAIGVPRLLRAGFDPQLVLGHSARGRDAAAVHAWFMQQPALRASLLHRDMTHLGIGVVRDADGRLVVTQLVARLAPPIDPPRARAALLRALNEARGARGAPPLQAAAELRDVAQRTADAALEPPFAPEAQLVADANRALAAYTIAYGRITALLASADGLEALSAFEPALDPTVTHVGIGLSRGDHPRLGVGRLVAVFALGYGR